MRTGTARDDDDHDDSRRQLNRPPPSTYRLPSDAVTRDSRARTRRRGDGRDGVHATTVPRAASVATTPSIVRSRSLNDERMNDDGAVVDRSIEGFYPGVRIQDYRYLVYGNEDYTICPNPGSERTDTHPRGPSSVDTRVCVLLLGTTSIYILSRSID